MLVGVDDHSDYPAHVVSALPRVGPDLTVDIDVVRALEPDLVLASLTVPGHERNIAELERAGLPFIAPEPVTLEDVFADITLVAEKLGVPERGVALKARLSAELESLRAPENESGEKPRLLVEWWPKPTIFAARRSWVHDLITWVGAENAAAAFDVKSLPVDAAAVHAMRPDALVLSWCGVPFEKYRARVVRRRDDWRGVPAFDQDRIGPIAEAHLGRPGPRLVEGARRLRQIV
jgi:iron complex transport system substrate-binding protein